MTQRKVNIAESATITGLVAAKPLILIVQQV